MFSSEGSATGESLRGALRVSTTPATALERQRDGHLVTGVLPRTARAIRPDLQRKLLLLDDFKAEPQEEQRLAGQAEYDLEPESPSIDKEGLDQRLSHPAALLVVPDRQPSDFRELGAVDLDRKSTRLNSSHSQISYAVFC